MVGRHRRLAGTDAVQGAVQAASGPLSAGNGGPTPLPRRWCASCIRRGATSISSTKRDGPTEPSSPFSSTAPRALLTETRIRIVDHRRLPCGSRGPKSSLNQQQILTYLLIGSRAIMGNKRRRHPACAGGTRPVYNSDDVAPRHCRSSLCYVHNIRSIHDSVTYIHKTGCLPTRLFAWPLHGL